MDIRELQIFRQLATSLHFGKTSQICNLTPSALTRTIQRLEAELGHKLFTRDNRSVAITKAGELFKDYAEDVIRRWNELHNNLTADNILHGEISLYCSVTAVYSILPSLLATFRNTYPEVQIKLQTGDAARALTVLQNRDADVSIAALPAKMPASLEFLKIIETPLVFIAPSKNQETVVSYVNDQIDWQKTKTIMAARGLSRQRIDRWFKKKKIHPNIYAQVEGNEAIISLVSLGCGIGFVPQLVLEKSPLKSQVTILKNAPRLSPFSVGVCTAKRSMTNPKVKAFWQIAAQQTANTG